MPLCIYGDAALSALQKQIFSEAQQTRMEAMTSRERISALNDSRETLINCSLSTANEDRVVSAWTLSTSRGHWR